MKFAQRAVDLSRAHPEFTLFERTDQGGLLLRSQFLCHVAQYPHDLFGDLLLVCGSGKPDQEAISRPIAEGVVDGRDLIQLRQHGRCTTRSVDRGSLSAARCRLECQPSLVADG